MDTYENSSIILFDAIISIGDLLQARSDGIGYYSIEYLYNALEKSKITKINDDINKEKELYLIDLLSYIYKYDKNLFKYIHVETFNSLKDKELVRHDFLKANEPLTAGKKIILESKNIRILVLKNGIYGLGINDDGSGYVFWMKSARVVKEKLKFHRNWISPVERIFSVIDLDIDAQLLAKDFISQIEKYNENMIRENYRKFCEKNNLPASELIKSTIKTHRVTHCYACRGYLETGVNLECSACHWLVCGCGACGCGYKLS